ncbi:MAG: hypothetical protein U0Q16_38710 [Bryobacteraceae bacterium]
MLSVVARAIAPLGARYIEVQRDRLAAAAQPLDERERSWLARYFESTDIDRVRVLEQDPLPVSDPPLAAHARRFGFDFPSIALVDAITFDFVIATTRPMPPSLLFHEMVHVAQFRMLGVREFTRQYALGFLETRRYESIPLERIAFELEDRFTSGETFRVDPFLFVGEPPVCVS